LARVAVAWVGIFKFTRFWSVPFIPLVFEFVLDFVPSIFSGIERSSDGVHESVPFPHFWLLARVEAWVVAVGWWANRFWAFWLFAVKVWNFSGFANVFVLSDGLGLLDGLGAWNLDGFFNGFAEWNLGWYPFCFVALNLPGNSLGFSGWNANVVFHLSVNWNTNVIFFGSVTFFDHWFWWANWWADRWANWWTDWLAWVAVHWWAWIAINWWASWCAVVGWLAWVAVPLGFATRVGSTSSEDSFDGLSETAFRFAVFFAWVVSLFAGWFANWFANWLGDWLAGWLARGWDGATI